MKERATPQDLEKGKRGITEVQHLFTHPLVIRSEDAHFCLEGIQLNRMASGSVPGLLHGDAEGETDQGARA
ncbi:MAG: hypothetical protein QXR87_06985 [Candidatus Hadarchaeales archaeon]